MSKRRRLQRHQDAAGRGAASHTSSPHPVPSFKHNTRDLSSSPLAWTQVSKANISSPSHIHAFTVTQQSADNISGLQKSLPVFARTPQSALVSCLTTGSESARLSQSDPAFSRLCDPASSTAKSEPRGSRAEDFQTAESFLIRAVQLKIHNLCRATSPMLSELRREKLMW
ncbi:hypothetical protein TCAP_00765 [Tolypocladium capitatum]|uniref:Uncharacterized protein n=1 Tax=Tolypocladium capitatum TaxID=45235 RepID=A0A2K3QP49_9HYPO|nr:hypothetical protein TCAP_00765 [Tolypocladium capitatum]